MMDDIFGKIYLPGVPLLYNVNSSVSLACSEVFAMILSFSIKFLTCVSIFCSCDQSSASLILMSTPEAYFLTMFLALYGQLFFGVYSSFTLESFSACSLIFSTVPSGV